MEEPIHNEYIKNKFAATHSVKPTSGSRFYQMDIVRYFLAISVVIAHFNIVFECDYYWPITSGTAVGAFFGLSGFLVYASFLRHRDIKEYLLSRARRILPPYLFIVIGCAFLFCMISELSLDMYFLSTDFWKYLVSNIFFLNFLEPNLPGVFSNNVVCAVNGSLWTLKVEWMLYISIPIFFYLIKKLKIKFIYAIIVLFLFSVLYRQLMLYAYNTTGKELYRILSYQFAGQFAFFYTGVLCYHLRHWILNHKLRFFFIGILILLVNQLVENISLPNTISRCISDLLFPIGIVITCLAISVSKPISPIVSKLGNCSYEIYLFHFPILQCLANSSQICTLPKWIILFISLTIILLLSYTVNKLKFRRLNLLGSCAP